jgi:hypothetical protein
VNERYDMHENAVDEAHKKFEEACDDDTPLNNSEISSVYGQGGEETSLESGRLPGREFLHAMAALAGIPDFPCGGAVMVSFHSSAAA